MTGFFITFEGCDGVGKTTQIKLLNKYFQQKGYQTLLTREPGGTPGAESIRELILSGKVSSFGPFAELFLFTAARIDHVNQVIQPALQREQIVLCDRFIDSTIVYQENEQVSKQLINETNKIAIGTCMPQLTFLLDLSAEKIFKRISNRGYQNEFDNHKLEEHEKRRQRYLTLAKIYPERIKVIDAAQTKEVIAEQIQAQCEQWF